MASPLVKIKATRSDPLPRPLKKDTHVSETTAALYQRIAEQLRDDISAGAFPVGSSLPAEVELARRFSVAPGTIRQSVKELVAEGILSSRRGARKVVIDTPRPQSHFDEFRSFAQWAQSTGKTPGGRVQHQEWEDATADDIAALGVPPDSRILVVQRLRTLDGEPVMVERTRYTESLGVKVEALRGDAPSVTNLLRELFDVEFAAADHIFSVGVAEPAEAELLGAAPGTPVLVHRRLSRDRYGNPLERAVDKYLPGTVSLAVANNRDANPLNWIEASPKPVSTNSALWHGAIEAE